MANAGTSGEITNSGTITIDENYTPTDTDTDGDLDGVFAQGSGRFGIHTLGAFTGPITNSGTITVEGNQSAALQLDGTLTGNLTSSGTINVLGDNSYGIKTGNVSGNVSIPKGTITAQGANSVGVAINGDVGGALVIQGGIQSTGYRYTSVPADTSKLDADDLLQGGSALVVGGDVAGGILFDAPPKDLDTTDTDEDDDGIPDASETKASIISLGAAPAVVIGSATEATTIGAVANSGGRGIVMKGSIVGSGLYKGVAGNALVIGGLGNAVTVTGGMTVSGTISASALEANATAVRIGTGGSVAIIENSGSISAAGGGTATTGATAIQIDAGATVNAIKNTGSIVGARNGADGTIAGIVDKSGTLTLIENSGLLGAANASTLGEKGIAFDLQANASGVTVRQLVVTTGVAPTIAGQMLFGSGNDVLDVADGTVVGTAKFGAGNNSLSLSGDAIMEGGVQFGSGGDTLQLAGTSKLTGDIDFGGGADLFSLAGTSAFNGKLSGSAGLAVSVGTGSTLNATNLGTVNLASLTTGANSRLGVTIDSSTGTETLYNVTGSANFGAGTGIDIHLVSLGNVEGTYKVLQAGSLTGASGLVSSVESLPFIFDSSLVTSTPNEVSVTIRQKTATELGLNASEGSILGAVLNAADADAAVAGVFLGVEDSATLRNTLQQMLPDHAGGAFETATKGSRLLNRAFTDPKAPLAKRGDLGFWMQQMAWGGSKSIGSSSSYDISGWGAAGGVEHAVGPLGAVGLSISYLSGKDGRDLNDNELVSSQYEGGAYWRGSIGPVRAFARATYGTLSFNGSRFFSGTVNGAAVTREAKGKWNGNMFSGSAGVSYDAQFGAFSVRPTAAIEYYSLKEKGYTETGGGEAFDLTVDSRKSNETAAMATVALGYELMRARGEDDGWFRVELEGGRREILSGKLGVTTARFGDGDPFSLTPEKRTSGFTGALRLTGGGSGIAVTGEVNGEEIQEKMSLGGRLGLQFTF